MSYSARMIISAGISNHPAGFEFTRERGFEYWTMGLSTGGSNQTRCGGKRIIKQAYDLSFFKPDTAYHNSASPGHQSWQGIWFIFKPRPEWLSILQYQEYAPGLHIAHLQKCKQRHAIKKSFQDALNAFSQHTNNSTLIATHHMEAGLLAVHDFLQEQNKDKVDARIMQAADRLSQHFDRPIDVDSLAHQAELSPSRFAHLFKQQIGSAPMAYREQQRMKQARALLIANELSIQDIAWELGYESPFHFSKRFKHHHQLSPKFFRQQMYNDGFLVQWE